MFRSLFAKLTLVLLILFCLLGILVVSLTLYATDRYQQEVNQNLNRQVASHIVNESGVMKDGKIDQGGMRKLFHSLMVFNPSLEIYLLDTDGGILKYSAPAWKVVRQSVDIEPLKRFLAEEGNMPIKGDDPRDFEKSKIFSAAPVYKNDQLEGYLYVVLGGEQYDNVVQRVQSSRILKLTLLIFIAGLCFSMITGIALFAGITRRLKKLSVAMKKFEQHPEFEPSLIPSYTKKGDEVDQLTSAFSMMAEKLHFQLDKLQTTDKLRRELVANVSHDLRTPLATLQGYIETLLIKEGTLDLEQRRDYLRIAIKHCQRLNKLVLELFELAKLDSRETLPNREPFNLAELIQDIVQKFLVESQKKNIQIVYGPHQAMPFVLADISLIERVLENLIDNALRHTPAGGEVRIDYRAESKGISLSVSDTGCGIPADELPYIFDRFYQLDKNRTLDNGSSGLGLAIVKRIIELHQSVIKVTSVPNRQTVFSFFLPMC